MKAIIINQKVLDLSELMDNGIFELESGYEVRSLILDEFEFTFDFEIDFSHYEYDRNPYEEPSEVEKVYLTELISATNLDTDEEITLTEQEQKLILAVANEKNIDNGI